MNDTQQIENYLLNNLSPQEKLLMEAKLLLNPKLQDDILWQERSYQLIKQYGRAKLKSEIEMVTQKIFTQKKFSKFRNTIFKIFKNKL